MKKLMNIVFFCSVIMPLAAMQSELLKDLKNFAGEYRCEKKYKFQHSEEDPLIEVLFKQMHIYAITFDTLSNYILLSFDGRSIEKEDGASENFYNLKGTFLYNLRLNQKIQDTKFPKNHTEYTSTYIIGNHPSPDFFAFNLFQWVVQDRKNKDVRHIVDFDFYSKELTAVHDDGDMIVGCSRSGCFFKKDMVNIYSVNSLKKLVTIAEYDGYTVTSLALSPDKKTIAIGLKDCVEIYSLSKYLASLKK